MLRLDIGNKRSKEILLAFILVAALLFRIIIMMHHSYVLDDHELMSLELSNGVGFLSLLAAPVAKWTESNGVLYYYVLNLLMNNALAGNIIVDGQHSLVSLSHNQIILAKMLSVISSLLSCCLVYKICKKLGNRTAGIYAAFLLGIHCGNICISDYIRFYSFNTFFCCLSTYLLLCLQFNKNISIYVKILYVLSLLACTSSMMCSSFLIISHFVYCIIKYNCKKKVFKFFSMAAFWQGIYFCLLWIRDSNALERKSVYYSLSDQWINILSYSLGVGIINNKSLLRVFFEHINGMYYKTIFLCLFANFLILIVLQIIRCCGNDCFLFFNELKTNAGEKNLYRKDNDILLLSLSLLILPSAIMLLIYPFTNIINYGNTSFLHPGIVLFLAYFMYSAKKYIRWSFLILVLALFPFSLVCFLNHDLIMLKWEHGNNCYIVNNFSSDKVILSSDGKVTVFTEKDNNCYVFHYDFENRQSNSGRNNRDIEEYVCNLVSNSPVQFWFSYDKSSNSSSYDFLKYWLFNISRRVDKNPNIMSICME